MTCAPAARPGCASARIKGQPPRLTTMLGTCVTARPVDLLAAISFLQLNRSNAAPRALRYEFEPDQPARLVLEPWEQVIPLKGTEHNYQEKRVIRTWGRRRLHLLEPLLP